MIVDAGSLKAKYSAIVDAYNNKSSILPVAKIISVWTPEDIKMWSKSVKEHHIEKTLDEHFYPEMLAVIKHANKLATGHELRIVQLLSLLLLLDAKDKGRLAEIAPAEGKTSIISMFAVIKYLQGHTVDVVTSSPVLADFAVKEKQKFYELFNATVAGNWDENSAPKFTPLESGFKSCYSADIVYGDAHSFQWDALRHEYEQEGTRGVRPYDTVIIDEVDSLLIDDAAHYY